RERELPAARGPAEAVGGSEAKTRAGSSRSCPRSRSRSRSRSRGARGAHRRGRPVIDVSRALRVATDTGEVRFGLREVRRAAKAKSAKIVVVSSNCPPDAVAALGEVRLLRFPGTNVDLGAACGEPFSVAGVAGLSAGVSKILGARGLMDEIVFEVQTMKCAAPV